MWSAHLMQNKDKTDKLLSRTNLFQQSEMDQEPGGHVFLSACEEWFMIKFGIWLILNEVKFKVLEGSLSTNAFLYLKDWIINEVINETDIKFFLVLLFSIKKTYGTYGIKENILA